MKPASPSAAIAVFLLLTLVALSCKKTETIADEDKWRKDLTGIYIGQTSQWSTPQGGSSQFLGTVNDTFEVKLGPYPDKVRIDDNLFLMNKTTLYFAGYIEAEECDSVTGSFNTASFSWERNNECSPTRLRTLFLGSKDY